MGRVELRCTDELKARMESAAGVQGVSEWLRSLALAALEGRAGGGDSEGPVRAVHGRPVARPSSAVVRQKMSSEEILARVRAAAGAGSLDLAGKVKPDPRRR